MKTMAPNEWHASCVRVTGIQRFCFSMSLYSSVPRLLCFAAGGSRHGAAGDQPHSAKCDDADRLEFLA